MVPQQNLPSSTSSRLVRPPMPRRLSVMKLSMPASTGKSLRQAAESQQTDLSNGRSQQWDAAMPMSSQSLFLRRKPRQPPLYPARPAHHASTSQGVTRPGTDACE
ncbi:hypothetical protein TARUN_9964 [Trichoderma arundinaceum]|uniref:Uncharacterized protein n=1 Tax=Trichoderma arundinaceum TaxID=490622 RepID=A0A395N825_TRIAR|nr:hypothetical protein TARUN_9964 [Trichoderma arundinaceum]